MSWISPRVRRRPGRWRRASVSSEAQRRPNGSSHQVSPKSSSPVVATAAARRSSGSSETSGAPVVAEAAPERDHLVRPRGCAAGGPGHGASPYPQREAGAPDGRTGDGRRPDVDDRTGRAREGECGERRRDRSERRRDRRGAGRGRPTARSARACPSPSSTTRCRRRRCCAHLHPATPSWRWPGWCTTSATSCRAAPTRRTPRTGRRRSGGALGERVAGIVALHVEAKRYLVATEGGYGGVADHRQRGLAGPAGRRPVGGGGRGVPGPARGGGRAGPAPGRRQGEGGGTRGRGARPLDTAPARRSPGSRALAARADEGPVAGRIDPCPRSLPRSAPRPSRRGRVAGSTGCRS